MKGIILLTCLLGTAAWAQSPETLNQLQSTDLDIRDKAYRSLQAAAAEAGRPGADDERVALCNKLCEILKNNPPDFTARLILQELERIGGKESLRALAGMLQTDDPHLQDAARRALTKNPAPDAGRALMAYLKKGGQSPKETVGLIDSLGVRQHTDAIPLLAEYLDHTDPVIFEATARTLVKMQDTKAVHLLANHLEKCSGDRRTLLITTLMKTDSNKIFHLLYKEEPETVRALGLLGQLVNGDLESLPDLLKTDSPLLWSVAIEGASQSRNPRLYDWIAVHLQTLSALLQLQALGALEQSRSAVYAERVEPLLSSPQEYVSDAAAQSLSRIGRTESIPLLLETGTDASLDALSRLDVDGVDNRLLEIADNESSPQREKAIRALARRGRSSMMSRFLAYAQSDSQPVAEAGLFAVGLMGRMDELKPMADLLLKRAETRQARTVQKTMVDIIRQSTSPEDAVSVLTAVLNGASSPRGQAMILQVLAQVGSAEARKSILEACRASDPALKKQGLKLLSNWTDDEAIPDMLNLAADPSTSLSGHVQLMRGVSRLLAGQKTTNEKQLINALEICRRPDELKSLIPMLEKMDSKEAEPLLEKFRNKLHTE